jgi:predicted ribosomally synthesized peptide with SipW-like signal peptide
MKKNLILPVLTLLLIAVLAYGVSGSAAWFSDTAVIETNVINTGTVDLALSDVYGTTPVLEPGGDYKEILRFCAVNQGSTNLKWRGHFTDIQAPAGLMDQILISVIINPTGDFSGNYGPVMTVWFMDVPIQELAQPNGYLLLDPGTNPEPFKPADKTCYTILARLGSTATNTYQQAVFSATLQLNATQWISTDPDWIE